MLWDPRSATSVIITILIHPHGDPRWSALPTNRSENARFAARYLNSSSYWTKLLLEIFEKIAINRHSRLIGICSGRLCAPLLHVGIKKRKGRGRAKIFLSYVKKTILNWLDYNINIGSSLSEIFFDCLVVVVVVVGGGGGYFYHLTNEEWRMSDKDWKGTRIHHRLTLDLWFAKDNRFLNPKSSHKMILMGPLCRLIRFVPGSGGSGVNEAKLIKRNMWYLY